VTTPGGVPNLPVGALTLDTLVSRLEDMSPEAMRARAGERWPSIFGYSTGGDIMSDLSLSGIIAKLFSGFNSVVANADPADIDGPEDLPGLLWDFITSLPVVGELVGLLEAIIGEYDGDDEVLLAIQEIFMPLRRLVQLVAGKDVDWPTAGEVAEGWEDLGDALASAAKNAISEIRGLIDISWLTDEHQNLILESGYDAPITVVAEDDPAITQDPTDGIPGTTPLGCLRIELDGQNHERIGELIPVGKGWELSVSSGVRRESVTAAAGALRVELQPYMLAGDVATPVGARVVVASVASPAGSSAGWETISGTWTVPSDGSVNRVAVIPRATSAATAGVVKFDNTTMVATQAIPQNFIKDLLADLESLMNWIGTVVDTLLTRLGLPPTGSLLDRIHDLGDEIQLMQERGEDALEGLADKLGLTDWTAHLAQLLSNPGALLGQLGMGQTTGLSSAINEMNQVRDLLAGLVVTPINSTVQAIKDALSGQAGKLSRLTGDGKLDKTNVLGLQVALDGAGQDVRDAICNALGVTGTGHTAADVLAALTSIPASVVQSGIDGVTNLDNGLQKILDSVVAGAGDLVGTGFSFADMIAQITGLRKATAGANSAVLDVQSQLAGLNPAASSEIVNFAEFANAGTPPSMFTKINDVGSGGIITSGGQLVWSGGTGREFWAFNGGPLQTDLFEVSAVLPAVPSHGWLGADDNNFVYLFGRCDSGGDNMVIARAGWDEVRIYSYNSGTFTQIGSPLSRSDVLTGGCRISFKGGTVLEPRRFTVAVNGEVVHNVLDSGNVSLIGSSYRLCGHGIEKGGSYDTAKIATWAMMDGGASAGSGVVAGYTASGLTNLGIWKGTAAQYAAIGTKSSTTIYVVAG